jgi:hypothetical protein
MPKRGKRGDYMLIVKDYIARIPKTTTTKVKVYDRFYEGKANTLKGQSHEIFAEIFDYQICLSAMRHCGEFYKKFHWQLRAVKLGVNFKSKFSCLLCAVRHSIELTPRYAA